MTRPVPLILFILLLTHHSDSSPLPSPKPSPETNGSQSQNEDTSGSEKIIFLVLHLFGVLSAMLASATRLSYPSTIAMDICMTITFYISAIVTLGISLYVTYEYSSPDMLLIGTAVGVVIAGRSLPRLWSTKARHLHWAAPMWRTRNGKIYRRVRRKLKTHEESAEVFWNGYVFQSTLIDGEPIDELVEKKPRHWEESVGDWKTFVSRGRLGDRRARRAAMALRMAYTVPLPVSIECGAGEYYAARGTLGVEVANMWKTEQNVMGSFSMLSQREECCFAMCDRRTELAIVLHIKMLLYASGSDRDRGPGRDWNIFVNDWLFGEVVCSDASPMSDVLACGEVGGGSNKYWNLLRKSDSRVETIRNELAIELHGHV